MSNPEIRRKKGFSSEEKQDRRREVGYCCEGCGRKMRKPRAKHTSNPALESHHEQPMVLGGGRFSGHRILCGPKSCHEVADRAAIGSRISFSEIEATLGRRPFQQYLDEIRGGDIGGVTANVIGRVRKAELTKRMKHRRAS